MTLFYWPTSSWPPESTVSKELLQLVDFSKMNCTYLCNTEQLWFCATPSVTKGVSGLSGAVLK
jgi:alpha-amylase/alpha-mannosidase (GH57 family)